MNREQAEASHKKFVDEGHFDALPLGDYAPGDIVAVRHSGIVHGVLEVHRDSLLLDDGEEHYEVEKCDVRSGSDYSPAVHAFFGMPGTLTVDRWGHAVRETPINLVHDEWV